MKNLKRATMFTASAAALILSAAAFARSTASSDVVAAGAEYRNAAAKCTETAGRGTVEGKKNVRCRSRGEEPICAASRNATESAAPRAPSTRETFACGNQAVPVAVRIA